MRSDSLLRKSVVNGKHTVFFAPVRAVTRYCPRASVPPRFAYAPILVFIGLRVGTASGVCGVAPPRGRAGFKAAQARGGSDARGGRCGRESGGFSAATLLITHYRIKKGTVWVVPNLNFPSIIQRSRGLHGDMNRKFAALAETDPEYATVRRIQELIRTPGLGLVLNLHDGGGFYCPERKSKERNPSRWGQCLIIDMAEMSRPDDRPDGHLERRGDAALAVALHGMPCVTSCPPLACTQARIFRWKCGPTTIC